MNSAMTTTAFTLDGYRVVKSFGVVRGIIVRSRSIFGTIGAGLQTLVGGNISIFTDLCEQTRRDALERMLEHARALGANAVIGLRYDATEIMQGVTEVLCYGTAVLVEPARRCRNESNGACKRSGDSCCDILCYQRRLTREVMVGHVGVGGANPIRVQSMITCDTMDTEASIAQTHRAGGGRLRDRAHHRADGERRGQPGAYRARDCASAAAMCRSWPTSISNRKPRMEAAKWVEKVRINPGNYADSKKFKIIEYTDEQYAAELERIRERFTPLVRLCQERGIAMRIGTNHGSLTDRIMNRYGDTPLGMVESALEFARIARDLDYHAFIFSMKSSNPKVMIEAYRLLVARLQRGRSGLELSDPSRRDRGRRRRRRADQERDRDRLAFARRNRRHDSRFAHRR